MASPDSFMEENKDFVLKIRIKAIGDGNPQIRRVRLPRLADTEGKLSYDELVGLVVTFVFPEDSPENYHVSMKYMDIDEDNVTVASTEELIDALEQYSDKRVLRIVAEVKPKNVRAAKIKANRVAAKNKLAASKAVRKEVRALKRERLAAAATTASTPPSQDPPLHNMLESFVGVLAAAVSNLQDGLAAPPAGTGPSRSDTAATSAAAKTTEAVTDAVAAAAAASSAAMEAAVDAIDASKIAVDASKVAATQTEVNDKNANGAPKSEIEESKATKEENKCNDDSKPTAPPSTETDKSEETNENEGARPFIHGRHTCDSCLKTPIVGRRFHAKNLPDYDLCQSCFENYSGEEIQFEPVELDRDRAFQERWHRRREKIMKNGEEGLNHRQGRRCGRGRAFRGVGRTPGPRASPPAPQNPPHGPPHAPHFPPPPHPPHGPHHAPHFPPPPPHIPFPPPHHGPPFPPFPPFPKPADMGGHPFGPHDHVTAHIASHVEHAFNNYDNELKEAIRRSLQDVAPKEHVVITEVHTEERKEATETVVEETQASEEEVAASSPVSKEDKIIVEIEADTPVQDLKTPPKVEPFPAKVSPVKAEPVLVSLETVNDAASVEDLEEGRSLNLSAEDVEELKLSANGSNDESDSSSIVKVLEETKETIDMTPSTKTPSVSGPSEKDDGMDLKPAAVERSDSESSKQTVTEDSFASDAIGSGDVAEAMGATLDMVAGVISEMLSEADSHNKESEMVDDDDAESASSGAMILDSIQSSGGQTGTSSDVENEWHVVDGSDAESASDKESSSPDEEVARGVEMLGSALFKSDLNTSGEIASTLSSSDSSFSSASSVPSTVPSLSTDTISTQVSNTQRARWAVQLSQLREIGFENETLCVETLERLHAANIGVDSDEEVSVTRVVNELLKH